MRKHTKRTAISEGVYMYKTQSGFQIGTDELPDMLRDLSMAAARTRKVHSFAARRHPRKARMPAAA